MGNFRFTRNQLVALLVAGLMWACPRAEAQGFGLSLTSTATTIQVSNSLVYTISVTNLTGLLLADAVVTNALPASVQILSTNASRGTITTTGSLVVFDLGPFAYGGIALLTVTAEPTAVGFITNTVTVASSSGIYTATTNLLIQVTNVVTPQADLGVAIAGPVPAVFANAVITNDWMTYTVMATNLGPSAAAGALLTNSLPPGVTLIGVSPANQAYTVSGTNLIFNLGTLAFGGYANLQFTVQPTNVGFLTFFASIGASGAVDPNPANNTAGTNINAIAYLPGTLMAVTNSGQNINLQNGLTEQFILLTNNGTNDVAAARLVVTGLPRQLYNAVGTNSGSPFVYFSAQLSAGNSVSLLLQYNPRGSFPFTNGQLQAFAVPLPNWTPPPASSASTNLNLSRIVELTNGNMLIEWPAVTNQAYTVVYSDNVLFSNAMIAPPSIVAPANRVQWIDYGPPATVARPANAATRYYRVFLNQ